MVGNLIWALLCKLIVSYVIFWARAIKDRLPCSTTMLKKISAVFSFIYLSNTKSIRSHYPYCTNLLNTGIKHLHHCQREFGGWFHARARTRHWLLSAYCA